jgi:hypothetical protein
MATAFRARARRAAFPLTDRAFTYSRYDGFLGRLASADVSVVPLRDFAATPADERAVLSLRHDVDVSLRSALELARLEHAHGLRATYFVLHTAPYWSSPALLDDLRRLQDEYGHEVGWHNDLVTIECVDGVDARAYLAEQLERLRSAGISVVGTASHGSGSCYRFGYHNNYFFSDFEGEVVPGFPNTETVTTPRGAVRIPKARLADFGLEYEAYHLGEDLYLSDTATASGRRRHPDELDPRALSPGEKAIVLTHPCHWDASVAAKAARLGGVLLAGRWRGYTRDPT